ncbi:MAG: hypothetical protein J7K22_02410 [Nanoarchaeota archaeon]|nr:hypothetical protein [Nanoarchaeota archaeon]
MKAQAISMDLFLAIVILLIIITAFSVIIFEFVNFQEQKAQNREMQIKGQAAMNSLITTPGNPPNWEEET